MNTSITTCPALLQHEIKSIIAVKVEVNSFTTQVFVLFINGLRARLITNLLKRMIGNLNSPQ